MLGSGGKDSNTDRSLARGLERAVSVSIEKAYAESADDCAREVQPEEGNCTVRVDNVGKAWWSMEQLQLLAGLEACVRDL